MGENERGERVSERNSCRQGVSKRVRNGEEFSVFGGVEGTRTLISIVIPVMYVTTQNGLWLRL